MAGGMVSAFPRAATARSLLAGFLLVTALPVPALVWLGFRLDAQDRLLARQREAEQRELTLEQALATTEHTLADSGPPARGTIFPPPIPILGTCATDCRGITYKEFRIQNTQKLSWGEAGQFSFQRAYGFRKNHLVSSAEVIEAAELSVAAMAVFRAPAVTDRLVLASLA
jgi:hypothetical protein